jgi:sec-independent protein translocase protein TatB
MFDMGFWELMVIGILSLVVLGPERLPVAIRTVKGWMTTAKKLSESVKSEITEELRINELHTNLKKAEQLNMDNLSPDLAKSIKSLKDAAAEVTRPYENKFNRLDSDSSSTPHSDDIPYDTVDGSSDTNEHIVFDGQDDCINISDTDQIVAPKGSTTEIKNQEKYNHE